MRYRYIIIIAFLVTGCDGNKPISESTNDSTIIRRQEEPFGNQTNNEANKSSEDKVYSNERFRNVKVERVGEHQYLIQGEGQIFEANFGWVVEDGHNELKKGYEMTDAGAPAWGKFKFTITVEKERENSAITLILFETSPKDGTRQHQLPVVLQ